MLHRYFFSKLLKVMTSTVHLFRLVYKYDLVATALGSYIHTVILR